MSNEVINKTEENAENSTPVEKQSNPEPSVEIVAEDNSGAAAVQEKQEPIAEAKAEPKTKPEEQQEPTSEAKTESASEESQEAGEMDFGAMLAQFEQEQVSYHSGETVTGKVVRVSDKGALVDFGYKSEGVVALEEFTSADGEVTIKQGDDVEVVIKNMGGEGPPTLSYFDAKSRRAWDEIEIAFKEEAVVKGMITDKTKGGLKVNLNGVEAFLPGSQIDSRPVRNLDALKGTEIEAKIVKFNRKRNNIVLSRKVITDEVVNKQKAETLSKIDLGYVVEGTVKNLTEYGAFVDIGGIDGLLHVTDMSWGRLHKPGDKFKVGEDVQVKVLKLDREKEKVSLGFKQLLPDPWSTVTEFYPVEKRVKGRISSVTEYGAFVELEPGVEGLVHISEMSWAKRMKHPKHFVKKGDEVEVQVLGIDPNERRISLGIKQLQPNPWDTIGIRYQVGSKVQGKVRNLTDFGAFVEIEDGVDGLVHVSDISWSKKVKHPKDILKKGQEVEAVITNIDVDGRRLSLSIKELTPSAWETFTNQHKSGDVVKGKISRFAGFGIFVELAPDLEGLCHISELSDDRVENAEDLFEVGQELDFKILRIEQDVEKIGLSARAVGREDDPIIESKSYSSEAKGGMASLGELANLKFGGSDKAAEETEKADDTEKKAETASETEKTEDTPKDEVSDKKEKKSAASEEPKADDSKEEEAKEEKTAEVKAETSKGDSEKEEPKAKEDVAAESKGEASTEEEGKNAESESVTVEEAKKDDSAKKVDESKETDKVKSEVSDDDSKKEESKAKEKEVSATKSEEVEKVAAAEKEEKKDDSAGKSEKADEPKEAETSEKPVEDKAKAPKTEAKDDKKTAKTKKADS